MAPTTTKKIMPAVSTLASCQPAGPEKLDETLRFSGHVVDQAHLLSDIEGQALTSRLGRFQRESGHQMAVVTVTSLHNEDIKAFSLTLAKRWGIGRKHFDDGILILIPPPNARRGSRSAAGWNGRCRTMPART